MKDNSHYITKVWKDGKNDEKKIIIEFPALVSEKDNEAERGIKDIMECLLLKRFGSMSCERGNGNEP